MYQECNKLGRRLPPRGIHVNMILPDNILTCVKVIRIHSFLAVGCSKGLKEVARALSGVFSDVAVRVIAHNEHLPDIAFALNVTLEAVFIAALALAYMTIPSEPL